MLKASTQFGVSFEVPLSNNGEESKVEVYRSEVHVLTVASGGLQRTSSLGETATVMVRNLLNEGIQKWTHHLRPDATVVHMPGVLPGIDLKVTCCDEDWGNKGVHQRKVMRRAEQASTGRTR